MLSIIKKAVISAFVFSVATTGASLAQDPGKDFERILNDKVVRVGAVEAFPSYRKDLVSGKWEGIFPETVEALFGAIGVKIEYVPTDWGTAAAGLQSGRFDVIGGYSATPERALAVAFTRPVARSDVGVAFVASDNEKNAANWSDLNKPEVKIAVSDGSASMRLVQRLLPDATFVGVKSEDSAIMELESGRADYFAAPDSSLKRYAATRNGNVAIAFPEPKIGQDVTFAMRKGEKDLQEWMNISIGALIADGQIPSIREKFINPKN